VYFWLVPNEDYKVEIEFVPDAEGGPEYTEDIDKLDLESGAIFELNSGDPI
jgi:hypothetical protein